MVDVKNAPTIGHSELFQPLQTETPYSVNDERQRLNVQFRARMAQLAMKVINGTFGRHKELSISVSAESVLAARHARDQKPNEVQPSKSSFWQRDLEMHPFAQKIVGIKNIIQEAAVRTEMSVEQKLAMYQKMLFEKKRRLTESASTFTLRTNSWLNILSFVNPIQGNSPFPAAKPI